MTKQEILNKVSEYLDSIDDYEITIQSINNGSAIEVTQSNYSTDSEIYCDSVIIHKDGADNETTSRI